MSKHTELSDEGKLFFIVISLSIIAISLFTFMILMFRPVEYSAECSISGINTGFNKDINFTGFSLNNTEIKCDINGKAPLIFFKYVLLGADE